MKKLFKKRYLLLLPLFTIIFYLFWGPLFPWNPFKPGYEKIKTERATIFVHGKSPKDSVIFQINKIIGEAEKLHGLKYTDHFKVIIPSSETTMKRFLPWMEGKGFSVALSMVNVIYIGSTARKSANGIEPYLKHEMSHLLLGQNTSFEYFKEIQEQGWFSEGIAEYFGQRSFYTKDELITLMKHYNLSFLSLNEANPLKISFSDLKLKYSYYRFFIEFLVDNYGLTKLQLYIKKYIDNPEGYKKYFKEIYYVQLEDLLNNYKKSLNY